MTHFVEEYSHAIINQAPAGHPSDVPARLLQACDTADAAAADQLVMPQSGSSSSIEAPAGDV